MNYTRVEIPESSVPRASDPQFQHLVDTYAGETNKTASVWRSFRDGDLDWRPHPKSATVLENFRHELLSQRRFFAELLGAPEPPAAEVLPGAPAVASCTGRFVELAAARLPWIASRDRGFWLERAAFFDVERERIWIFWRRVLHSAHHRTQLTLYLRLLDRPVPPIYGPTADVNWSGSDPTQSMDAAGRR